MITIIAGSRHFNDYDILLEAIEESEFAITEIISGGSRGVDALGERYAMQFKLPLCVMKAEWAKHGKAAGPIRNKLMAKTGEALIALWDYKSPGTRNMIECAIKKKLKVFVYGIGGLNKT